MSSHTARDCGDVSLRRRRWRGFGSIVTRESASDALYTTCFPERVLLEQFSRSQQLEARLADKDPVSKRTPGRSSKH